MAGGGHKGTPGCGNGGGKGEWDHPGLGCWDQWE